MPIQFKEHILGAKLFIGGRTRSEFASLGSPAQIRKMSSNENPLGPSPVVTRAILRSLECMHEYQHQDDHALRDALANHFAEAYTADQFITTNGGSEFLDLVCEAFVSPGEECIISSPCFMAYASAIQKAGGIVIDVPLLEDDKTRAPEGKPFEIDVEGILDAVKPCTKLVFVCSPNNPTGSIISSHQLESLCKHLPDHVVVIMDEVYHQYATDQGRARLMPLIKMGVPIIGLHTFSKAYGLAGLRLGYAFSTPEIARYLQRKRRPFMINSLTIAAGIAALGDQEHIIRTLEMTMRVKQWLYTRMDELGIKYWMSQANFILFEAPYPAALLEADLRHEGIMVRLADVFKAPGCIRVSIGAPDDQLAFITALRHFWEQRIREGVCPTEPMPQEL